MMKKIIFCSQIIGSVFVAILIVINILLFFEFIESTILDAFDMAFLLMVSGFLLVLLAVFPSLYYSVKEQDS